MIGRATMRIFVIRLFLMSATLDFAQTQAPYPKPTYKEHPDPHALQSRTNATVICTTGQDVTFWKAATGAQVGTVSCPLRAHSRTTFPECSSPARNTTPRSSVTSLPLFRIARVNK